MISLPPITSLDDLRARLRQLPPADDRAAAAARAREAELTKPLGSLGRLEELVVWLAAWQGRETPRLERVAALVFAGNHGVAAQGVSAYPSAVTAQMVANYEAGGAAINQLCRVAEVELRVIALELDRPTADFSLAPAMSERECLDALCRGMETVTSDLD
ncbi:MAG: nicotinate-nucleotide--dimethylbenzimidazole phosphoribosyltransferase, partial [Geminicoccaceae bacterium]